MGSLCFSIDFVTITTSTTRNTALWITANTISCLTAVSYTHLSYRVGKIIKIYYDNDNPDRVAVGDDYGISIFICAFGFIFIAVGGDVYKRQAVGSVLQLLSFTQEHAQG